MSIEAIHRMTVENLLDYGHKTAHFVVLFKKYLQYAFFS